MITEKEPAEDKILNYCKNLTPNILVLDKILIEAVRQIRELDLDIIIIGCNISATTNFSHLVFQHKVARMHVANFCNPISTGIYITDYFLLGNNIKYDGIENDFSEKLIFTSGSPGCLDMSCSNLDESKLVVTREAHGIPVNAVLYISGAVCYKLIPEVLDVWMSILSRSPGSYLLLHPYNPNWTGKYPKRQFLLSISSFITKYNIDPARVKIDSTNFKSRSDLKQLIKIGDIYLDTFPYSGFVSMSEALDCAVPPVVFRGETMRGRQASALLMDLDLENLIAANSNDYIEKALFLFNNSSYRLKLASVIAEKMAAGPHFYNSTKYAKEVSNLLFDLVNT